MTDGRYLEGLAISARNLADELDRPPERRRTAAEEREQRHATARLLRDVSTALEEVRRDEDLLRAVWEFAVGAVDAAGNRRRFSEVFEPLHERWGYPKGDGTAPRRT